MSKPYIVHVLDFGDTVERLAFQTFEEALQEYREAVLNYATRWHYVSVYNEDIADGGYGDDGTRWDDGLTEDERDALTDAMP